MERNVMKNYNAKEQAMVEGKLSKIYLRTTKNDKFII